MDSKLKGKQQSRLGRLNANKNIDYDPLPSTSSSPPPPSNPILFGNQTSFRIEGIDGEIDRICFTLGLSGPDDFSIPFDAWLAKKPKSTRIQQQQEEIELSPIQEEEEIPNSEVNDTTFVLLVTPTPIDRAINEEEDINSSGGVGEEAELLRRIDASNGEQVEEVLICKSDRGGWGINGVRPPLLVPPSPLENEVEDSPSSVLTSSASSDKVDGMEIGLGETTLSSEPSPSASTSSDSDHNDDEEGEGYSNDDDQDGGGDGVDSTTNANHMYIISPNVSFKREIKSWTKGALLGSGSFGTVYEGFSNDGFFFAVKEVSLLDQGNQAKQSIFQLEQEISLLSQFEHENIVQYLGTDKDEEKLYIFLELVPKGSLAQLYHKYDLQDSQVSAYTRQILHGLKYLHDRNVVHRDIKCANILVDVQGYVKLADFGLAKATKLNDVKSCKGTAFWMAPEVVNRKSRGYGLAADIWSLGCTVLEMLTRQLPYSHLECMQALFRIGRGEPPPVSNSLSATARDFIHQCLRVKADDRPTAALLLEHPFVNRLQSASSGSGSPSQPNWRRS